MKEQEGISPGQIQGQETVELNTGTERGPSHLNAIFFQMERGEAAPSTIKSFFSTSQAQDQEQSNG